MEGVTPVAKYFPIREASSIAEAFKVVEMLYDKLLYNRMFDITAGISKSKAEKLISGKAIKKSINVQLHTMAIANIDWLFENAEIDITHPDTKGTKEIERVHRLGTLLWDKETGAYIPIKITVFEYNTNTGNKIYTIEAIDIERQKSAGQLEDESHDSPHSPIADFIAKIEILLEKTKQNTNISTK